MPVITLKRRGLLQTCFQLPVVYEQVQVQGKRNKGNCQLLSWQGMTLTCELPAHGFVDRFFGISICPLTCSEQQRRLQPLAGQADGETAQKTHAGRQDTEDVTGMKEWAENRPVAPRGLRVTCDTPQRWLQR